MAVSEMEIPPGAQGPTNELLRGWKNIDRYNDSPKPSLLNNIAKQLRNHQDSFILHAYSISTRLSSSSTTSSITNASYDTESAVSSPGSSVVHSLMDDDDNDEEDDDDDDDEDEDDEDVDVEDDDDYDMCDQEDYDYRATSRLSSSNLCSQALARPTSADYDHDHENDNENGDWMGNHVIRSRERYHHHRHHHHHTHDHQHHKPKHKHSKHSKHSKHNSVSKEESSQSRGINSVSKSLVKLWQKKKKPKKQVKLNLKNNRERLLTPSTTNITSNDCIHNSNTNNSRTNKQTKHIYHDHNSFSSESLGKSRNTANKKTSRVSSIGSISRQIQHKVASKLSSKRHHHHHHPTSTASSSSSSSRKSKNNNHRSSHSRDQAVRVQSFEAPATMNMLRDDHSSNYTHNTPQPQPQPQHLQLQTRENGMLDSMPSVPSPSPPNNAHHYSTTTHTNHDDISYHHPTHTQSHIHSTTGIIRTDDQIPVIGNRNHHRQHNHTPTTPPPVTTNNRLRNINRMLNPKKLNKCLSSLSTDQSYDDIISEATGVMLSNNDCHHNDERQHLLHGNTARILNFEPPSTDHDHNDTDNGIDNNNNDTVQLDNSPLSPQSSSDSHPEEDLLLTISVLNRVQDIEHKMQSFDDEDDMTEQGCFNIPSNSLSSCTTSNSTTTTYNRPSQCVFDFCHKPFFKHVANSNNNNNNNKGEQPQHNHRPPQSKSPVSQPDCCASSTSTSDSTETEQLNHTLKVVFLGSGNDTLSDSLVRNDPLFEQEMTRRRRKHRSTKSSSSSLSSSSSFLSKSGVSLSVKSWSPFDDHRDCFMRGTSTRSSNCSSIDGHKDTRFSLWEMDGLAKDFHHATQSICFSPDSLYVIVYKVPPITQNTDVGNCDDDFFGFAEEEAVQKAEQELHHHMDEHFFSWVDLLSKRAPEGCAILPVVSFDEDCNYGSDDKEASKRIRDCRDMLKRRILEERDLKAEVDVDHLNGNNIVFHCDDIPMIFPSRTNGSKELRQALKRLASWNSVFHQQLHKEITPLISCVRKIVSCYKKDGHNVLPFDDLHVKLVGISPEITHNEIIDALRFLSSVGDIIFFTKEDDGMKGREASSYYSNLSKFIILEPTWMAAVVSCILRYDWKVIRKNLNDSTHRRDSNVSILDVCMRSDKSSCPILSSQDSANIWEKTSFIKKDQGRISKLGSDDLLSFLREACEHCGIFVPFPIDEASTTSTNMPNSSAARYLLPGLCQEDPEPFWSFKSKETWKTTLCQSWLLKDRVPCGMFDQVKITALEELGGIVDVTTTVRVSQLLCWKTALYAKIIEEEEGNTSIVEFFIHLVRSDSLQCPASHTLERGMKLVVSAKGVDTLDCDIIWRLGYRNILDSIESVVKTALGVDVKREVSCPECMANSDPCEANVWEVDNNSFYEQTDPTMRCNSGHRVSTKMIYGSSDDDTDVMTVCTACSCTSSSTTSTCFREDNPGNSTEELLGAVVLVGLWDIDKERIVDVGTGFVADSSSGFILTAGHIFYDLKHGSKVGPIYKGFKNARAVIGTIHKSNEGVTAFFTYSAEIMTHDITKVDAVVLRITTKFENPIQCLSSSLKVQSDIPIHQGKFRREKAKRLKLMKPRIDEQIRIIGFFNEDKEYMSKGKSSITHQALLRATFAILKSP
eukprot:CAMPEP_0198253622 /NCGR_PEP_ID=MMETSP1447-20131203/4020_1 /TAXON_ID=420782 /ORGANISM="Chaetoceros dichaeta, Strain CCMP1751" /LENGTH=1646 /DNA_ID=CAMNT_0043939363 /DNA_START=64 /DNA_END=5005 /DNA_ORIENTATION=-